MEKTKKIFTYVLCYLMWIFTLILGLGLFLIIREVYLFVIYNFYAHGNWSRNMQVGFFDKTLLIFLSLAWIMLMIILEEYFRKGVSQNILFYRFTRILGPEMILIFAFNFLLVLFRGAGAVSWVVWIILVLELLSGLLLIWYSRVRKPPQPGRIESGGVI